MYLHQNLKYIHFVCKLLGVLYLRFDSKNNNPKFAVSRSGVFWCAFTWINSAVTQISSFTNKVDLNNFDQLENYVTPFVLSVKLISSIINYSRQKLLIQALNELAEVDKSQKSMRSLIGNKLTLYISGIGIISLIIRVISGFSVDSTTLIIDKVGNIVNMVSSTFELLGIALFETYLLILRSRLQLVNKQLSNLTKTTQGLVLSQPRCFRVFPSNSNLKKLKKLRKLHSKLCSICEKINKVFAFQLVVFIGFAFVEFTGLAYKFIEKLQGVLTENYEWQRIIFPFLATLAKISSLTILCSVCTKTKNEVFKTGDILFKLKNKYESGISKEIQRFSRQILHWNLKFTAFDFFDIDMTLIYEIITTATTYVTILMQFRGKF